MPHNPFDDAHLAYLKKVHSWFKASYDRGIREMRLSPSAMQAVAAAPHYDAETSEFHIIEPHEMLAEHQSDGAWKTIKLIPAVDGDSLPN